MTAPAPVTARPAVVAAAVLLVVVVCGGGAAELLSHAVDGTVERTSTLTATAGRFVVDTDTGDVTLRPSTDGQVHVHTVVRHGLGEPELVEESTPEGVRLDVDCGDMLASHCDVRYDVEVPPAFEVVVGGTAGDVTANQLTGPLTVDRLEGDITVLDLSGPLDLRTATGEISGDDLRSEVVRVDSDTGDVRLELLTAPRSVDVATATGEVDLAVPGDTAYRVEIMTADGALELVPGTGDRGYVSDSSDDRGDVWVAVPHDPASSRVLRVDSDTGDKSIRRSR